ncbi:MAG: MBL fold metallo-hydrolase [Gemmatimonadota bacterium]
MPEGDRGASSFYFDDGATRILLDCGPGAVQTLARLDLPWATLTDLAITHFHVDHIGALPGLFFAFKHGLPVPRSRTLDVWGPVGTVALFDGLATTLGAFMIDPGFDVRIHELAAGDEVRLDGGTSLRTHKTPHTKESLAYRLDGDFGAVGYSGDTGRTKTLGPFMSEVNAFVCECSLLDHEVGENHLSPSAVASIAAAAAPDTLILSHIYPHVRSTTDVAGLVREAGYGGKIQIAHEGLRVEILRGPRPAPPGRPAR